MRTTVVSLLVLVASPATLHADAPCSRLPCPAAPEQAAGVLTAAAERHHWITVEEIGLSAGGRPLLAARLDRSGGSATWRLLFLGQQHGDEPAGGAALLHLVDALAADPRRLPGDVELWVVPQVNPDGAATDSRRNAAGVDLNRDHLTLSQPETQAVHGLARRIRPHLVVDGHEFTRDSSGYTDRGWTEWPLVMMDTANHPLLPDAVYRVGLDWVDSAAPVMAASGIASQRYMVGDAPPSGELRPSTLDADDARNGLALHAGALGFIIESGILRGAPDPQADIADRVSAHLALLERFLHDRTLRPASLAAVASSRWATTPTAVPVNTLWGAVDPRPRPIPVVDRATGRVLMVPTINRMDDRVVKRSVATPVAYVIDAERASTYRALLDRHAIPYEVIESPLEAPLARCHLDRLEETYDPVYERYGGRQIVTCRAPSTERLRPGSLRVPTDGVDGRRAAPVLEPRMLYGLYQFEAYRATVADDGALPVALEWP
jgi:hypothetical protein